VKDIQQPATRKPRYLAAGYIKIRADPGMNTRKTVAAKGSAGDSGSVADLQLSHAFFLITLIMRQALMKKRTLKKSSIRLLAWLIRAGILRLAALYVGVLPYSR
jgi:hypothetical protein